MMDYKAKAANATRMIKSYGNEKLYDLTVYSDTTDENKPWLPVSKVETKYSVYAVFFDNVKYFNKKAKIMMQSSVAYLAPKNIEDIINIPDYSIVKFNTNTYKVEQSEILNVDGETNILITLRLNKYAN